VIWGNSAASGAQVFMSPAGPLNEIQVSYSDVQGGPSQPGIVGGSVSWGPGNIDADPLFTNPLVGDYHLTPLSPCVDAGDPSYVALPGELDIDGQPRVHPPALDMGADEVHP
jgi:hypothetical protein